MSNNTIDLLKKNPKEIFLSIGLGSSLGISAVSLNMNSPSIAFFAVFVAVSSLVMYKYF